MSKNNTTSREEQRLSTPPRHNERLKQLALLINDNRFEEARRLWSNIRQEYMDNYRLAIIHVVNYIRSKVRLREPRVFIELFYDYFGPIIRRYVNHAIRRIRGEPRWINLLEAYAAKLYVEVMLMGDNIASSIVRLYLSELKNQVKERIRQVYESCNTLECIEEKINWILREIKRRENVHLSRHVDLFEQIISEALMESREKLLRLLERDARKLRAMYGYSASNIKRNLPYTTRFIEDEIICERIASMGDKLFKRKCL